MYLLFLFACIYFIFFGVCLHGFCLFIFPCFVFFICDTIKIEFVFIRDPCLTLFLNILLTQFSFFIIYQSGPKKTLVSPMKTAHAQLEWSLTVTTTGVTVTIAATSVTTQWTVSVKLITMPPVTITCVTVIQCYSRHNVQCTCISEYNYNKILLQCYFNVMAFLVNQYTYMYF